MARGGSDQDAEARADRIRAFSPSARTSSPGKVTTTTVLSPSAEVRRPSFWERYNANQMQAALVPLESGAAALAGPSPMQRTLADYLANKFPGPRSDGLEKIIASWAGLAR